MPPTVRGADADRLERSCGRRADSIRFGPSAYGVERAEVYISTRGFDPHPHDTYGIGVWFEATWDRHPPCPESEQRLLPRHLTVTKRRS